MTKTIFSPILVTAFLMMFSLGLKGQMSDYQYIRPITQVRTTGWHKIEIEKPVLSWMNDDFSDIRIFQVKGLDTIEVAYLIHKQEDNITLENLAFRIVNQSQTKSESFVTLRNEDEKVINRIEIDIEQQNYDVSATLEGSNNRLKWFTIEKNIRLLGIANDQVSFEYSTLNFEDSDYKFFRVKFDDPEIVVKSASIHNWASTDGEYQDFSIEDWQAKNDTDKKVTEIEVILKDRSPVSRVELAIDTKKDYYRPASIQYLKQTVKAETGDREIWRSFADFTVNSLNPVKEEGTMRFTEKLRITIHNFDDLPLPIKAIRVSGPIYHIISDLEAGNEYFLAYENPLAQKPRYDIAHFQDNIPEDLVPAGLGDEIVLVDESGEGEKSGSSFFLDFGLWIIMGIVVLGLGFFTLKMMKKAGNEGQNAGN